MKPALQDKSKIFEASVKTGTCTWAFISGSYEFVEKTVEHCYYVAKLKWPEDPTYINGDLTDESIAAIKRRVKKRLLSLST